MFWHDGQVVQHYLDALWSQLSNQIFTPQLAPVVATFSLETCWMKSLEPSRPTRPTRCGFSLLGEKKTFQLPSIHTQQSSICATRDGEGSRALSVWTASRAHHQHGTNTFSKKKHFSLFSTHLNKVTNRRQHEHVRLQPEAGDSRPEKRFASGSEERRFPRRRERLPGRVPGRRRRRRLHLHLHLFQELHARRRVRRAEDEHGRRRRRRRRPEVSFCPDTWRFFRPCYLGCNQPFSKSKKKRDTVETETKTIFCFVVNIGWGTLWSLAQSLFCVIRQKCHLAGSQVLGMLGTDRYIS